MEILPTSPTELSKFLECSVPYASQLLRGVRKWPNETALLIFRRTGQRVGALVGASDEEIGALDRLLSRAAA